MSIPAVDEIKKELDKQVENFSKALTPSERVSAAKKAIMASNALAKVLGIYATK